MKLFIATPMYGGMCTGHYCQSLLGLAELLNAHGVEYYTSFGFNESLITRARDSQADRFLKSDATHLLFIDADIWFEGKDVLRMLDADCDIICGVYPKKEINWPSILDAINEGDPEWYKRTGSYVVDLVDGTKEVNVNSPVEIKAGGTGFMLIKREVFEKLKPHVPTYKSVLLDHEGFKRQSDVSQFFDTWIDEQSILRSEDYYFCDLWRKHGGKVHAALWAKLSHIGTHVFDGEITKKKNV